MSRSLVQRAIANALIVASKKMEAMLHHRASYYFAAKRNHTQLLRIRDDMADGDLMLPAAFNRLDTEYQDMIDQFVQDNGIHPKEVFG